MDRPCSATGVILLGLAKFLIVDYLVNDRGNFAQTLAAEPCRWAPSMTKQQ